MYIYIYIYIYMYIHLYICMYIYTYTYIYIIIKRYKDICISMYFVCILYVCTYVYIYSRYTCTRRWSRRRPTMRSAALNQKPQFLNPEPLSFVTRGGTHRVTAPEGEAVPGRPEPETRKHRPRILNSQFERWGLSG